VEYLQELAQWLYYHELPLQDSIDLLQWAVDVVLSLQIELPSWLEAAGTEGHCFACYPCRTALMDHLSAFGLFVPVSSLSQYFIS